MVPHPIVMTNLSQANKKANKNKFILTTFRNPKNQQPVNQQPVSAAKLYVNDPYTIVMDPSPLEMTNLSKGKKNKPFTITTVPAKAVPAKAVRSYVNTAPSYIDVGIVNPSTQEHILLRSKQKNPWGITKKNKK